MGGSFFGHLAAGLGEGVGRGMQADADYQDRLANQLLIQQERAANARELQQMRSDTALEGRRMAAEARGAGGGGRQEFNLAQLMLQAETPEQQQRLAQVIGVYGGADAAGIYRQGFNLAGGPTTTTKPTAGDFARFDRSQETNSPRPVPTERVEAAAVDAERGRLALQRITAMLNDPGKLKGYADGEAQLLRNDVGAVTVRNAVRTKGANVEALNDALTPLNPKAGIEADKTSLGYQRLELGREREAGLNARDQRKGETQQEVAEANNDAKREKVLLEQAGSIATPKAVREKAAAELAQIEAKRKQRETVPAAAAAPAAAKQYRSPAASSAAFKAGNSY